MPNRLLLSLLGLILCATPLVAQEKTVSGRVTDEQGAGLTGVSVVIRGTTTGTQTGSTGSYSLRAAPGQVLQFRFIGTYPVERTVGSGNIINVTLRKAPTALETVVVTALGQTEQQRALGTAVQTVRGAEVAETQRENFVNALAGRVAGVEVVSTSGVPGASSSITIRGVSSLSSSNQPLMVVDGLPIDNKTMNSGVLASGTSGSTISFENRGVDFTNRAADINPEDIETITVLKGPEAAALYGIDAANGAIIITTKRGKPGIGGLEYSNSFRLENVRAKPELQRTFGPTTVSGAALGEFQYFGAPYGSGTTFYDNVDGFFRTGVTQKHNLAFSGASPESRINYRVASAFTRQAGVVPNTEYDRVNLTGASGAQVTRWLKTDLTMQYAYANNDQTFKGAGGPFLGLMLWPQTDNAREFLTPAGTRRRLTLLSSTGEIDNPFFNVQKNAINSKTNRITANAGITLLPWTWGDVTGRLGTDTYTNQNLLLRHPESTFGFSDNGIIDQADDITRNINAQALLNLYTRPVTRSLGVKATAGTSLQDNKSTVDALLGRDFLEPNFVSINNSNLRNSRTSIAQRRLVSAFFSATADWKRYLYVTVTGRNDWTSTIPVPANRFFYPAINTSLILTDAVPALRRVIGTGKLRAAYAEVGRDAAPYAYRPALQFKTTSYGGYGYDFWGPNLNLRPEFARSSEVGLDLTWFEDRLGLDVTTYRKRTIDQIVQNIRGSYATGFILFNLNGASTSNRGVEVTLRGTPVQRNTFTWDITSNFNTTRGRTEELPAVLPEFYNSDTWLYGNIRNGTAPGRSTLSLTGTFYLRNNNGDILIDPTTGLPIRGPFTDAGYDRQPRWTLGVQNSVKYRRLKLDMLVDFRRGGDVFNATQHFLTTRGLAMRTLDREKPRVITGVLRDGKENSATPTRNTIAVIPAFQPSYYTGMSEELFIEKNINWVRLRDLTLSYSLPARLARNALLFVTGTDLLLLTNYTGLDPIANGTSVATGGSGGVGIDFGNFPIPRGLNFGLRMGF